MNIDITKLSLDELDELTTKICSERTRRKEKECVELENALKDILSIIKEKGFYVYSNCCCCGEENFIESNNIRLEW